MASWDGRPEALQPAVGPGGQRDFTELTGRLHEPVVAMGFSKQELRKLKPVYHLTIEAAKDLLTGALLDRMFTDAEWADTAEECMDRIGLARRDEDAVGLLPRRAESSRAARAVR